MADLAYSFGAIAGVLFVTELTDKDAFLLISVSTRVKWGVAFAAGATAFALTTTLFVAAGSVIVALVPVSWVRVAGGVTMLGYAFWEARGLVGKGAAEREGSRVQKAGSPWKAFLALVAALALLDVAGDATEVLTIVFVAQYADPLLVFSAVLAGLLAATAVETYLGRRLGRVLTPARLRAASVAVFLVLGTTILALEA